MASFTRAIVRPPGRSFANGLTTANLGAPALDLALEQHAEYCAALETCGLAVTRLPADERFPDSTFVEDTALLTDRFAVLARPGAPSRQGEVSAIAEALSKFYDRTDSITSPGTLDAGDVCQVAEHFFIGISQRTNEAGAEQLARLVAAHGFTASNVDIRRMPGLLHLKSGISWAGGDTLILAPDLAGEPAFARFQKVVVEPDELYGANAVAINDRVLIPADHPRLARTLASLDFEVVSLPMSEFRKMDGGLSCLSLRF